VRILVFFLLGEEGKGKGGGKKEAGTSAPSQFFEVCRLKRTPRLRSPCGTRSPGKRGGKRGNAEENLLAILKKESEAFFVRTGGCGEERGEKGGKNP